MAKKASANSIKSLGFYLEAAAACSVNLAVCGAHGRGKTAYINQFADKNGYDEVVTVILSQLTPEDMVGIPVVRDGEGGQVTSFTTPDWLKKASDPEKKVILFFDELTNAEDDVFASVLSLLSERRACGVKLADSTLIVAAFNPIDIAPNAKSMSKAVRDRLCVIPIFDDVDAYTSYYEENGMRALSMAVTMLPEFVVDYSKSITETAYENAEFTFRSLEKAYMLFDYCDSHGFDSDLINTLLAGFGGIMPGKTLAESLAKAKKEIDDEFKISAIVKGVESAKELRDALSDAGIFVSEMEYSQLISSMRLVESLVDEKVFEKFMDENFTGEFKKVYQNER